MRGEGEQRVEVGEGSGASASAVVSPTTPAPGDDNPIFAIPRTEVIVCVCAWNLAPVKPRAVVST